MSDTTTNWAGNITFGAERLRAPASVGELQELVAGSRAVRALGTGHSFNAIADTTGDLVSTAGLPRVLDIDTRAGTATVSGGTRFGEITGLLHESGLALHNLGSLPHISVAGACATGTHGSGDGNGTLASAVRAVTYVSASGDLVTTERGDEHFDGSVVALGALGVVTTLTLDLVPAFDVRQWVYEDLPVTALRGAFDEVMSAAYSVSLFTRWRGDLIDQVWLKRRADAPGTADEPSRWLGAVRADGPRHPVPGMPADSCTPQLGLPGPSPFRLPHFRLEHTPSSGDELQSEYFVAREDAVAAFDALHAVRDAFAPHLQVGEIRSVAADSQWLSPAHRRDSVAFHFTWLPDTAAVLKALHVIEDALAPVAARPHWGKLFVTPPEALRGLYPQYDRFEHLTAHVDPTGKFRNDFLARYFPR
ncbi:FAD-binding protein [Streptomyces sp. OfavH-34-F]|uniref:D-arabinono-1,4-lactone oxidase n=1 Tax=Streptomyces sp. OfavH-34-F TaxID=2917760 RepID=UPI001EF2113E|nr:D-arabinono-1,4-lactone oxidase [Streptomyces sp. OfavH-34-F]MCG7524452.1 FAD-binding protein [Streptomyces sp. OfavH-34-F]